MFVMDEIKDMPPSLYFIETVKLHNPRVFPIPMLLVTIALNWAPDLSFSDIASTV